MPETDCTDKQLINVTKEMIYITDRQGSIIPVRWKDILMIRSSLQYFDGVMIILRKDSQIIESRLGFTDVRPRIMRVHPDTLCLSGFRMLIPKHSSKRMPWISECYITGNAPKQLESQHAKDVSRMGSTPEGLSYLIDKGYIEKKTDRLFELYRKQGGYSIKKMVSGVIQTTYKTDPKKALRLLARQAKLDPETAYGFLNMNPPEKGTEEFAELMYIIFSCPSRSLISNAFVYNETKKKHELKLPVPGYHYYTMGYSKPYSYNSYYNIEFSDEEREKYRRMMLKSVLSGGNEMLLNALMNNASALASSDEKSKAYSCYRLRSKIIGRMIGKKGGIQNLASNALELFSALGFQNRLDFSLTLDKIIGFLMRNHTVADRGSSLGIDKLWVAIAKLPGHIKQKYPVFEKLMDWAKKVSKSKYDYDEICEETLMNRGLWEYPRFFRTAKQYLASGKYSEWRIPRLIDMITYSDDSTRNTLMPEIITYVINHAAEDLLGRLSKIPMIAADELCAKMLASRLWKAGKYNLLEEFRRSQLKLIGAPAYTWLTKVRANRRELERNHAL